VPNYIVASAPFDPNQRVNAPDSAAAATKAGQYVAKGMEGDGQSTFPIYVMQIASAPEAFDVVATATVNRSVTVTPHVGP
jgi:hypothetical protein